MTLNVCRLAVLSLLAVGCGGADLGNQAALRTRGMGAKDLPLPQPLSVNPDAVDFGKQWVGTASGVDVVITNSAAFPVEVDAQVAGGDFLLVAGPSKFVLQPSEEVKLGLQFNPLGEGPARGTLELVSTPEAVIILDLDRLSVPLLGDGVGGIIVTQ